LSLLETLDQDFKTALKAKDELKLSVLRMLKTAIKNKEVEVRRKLEDEDVLALVSNQAKQRRDSIKQFEEGGRDDLVQREKAELAVLESYLPAQMDRGEIETEVMALLDELEAKSVKDMGRVMKTFMNRFAGQVDGKVVGEVVKQKLSTL
jgi:uncharacterized protein YqeY